MKLARKSIGSILTTALLLTVAGSAQSARIRDDRLRVVEVMDGATAGELLSSAVTAVRRFSINVPNTPPYYEEFEFWFTPTRHRGLCNVKRLNWINTNEYYDLNKNKRIVKESEFWHAPLALHHDNPCPEVTVQDGIFDPLPLGWQYKRSSPDKYFAMSSDLIPSIKNLGAVPDVYRRE